MVMPPAVTLRRFTVDDLDRFPPDGNTYELLDGVLFVTPAPMPVHEEVVSRLLRILSRHLEPWPEVRIAARSEVVLRPDHKLEPDLQVYRADHIPRSWSAVEDRWLAVEVASRSTRIYAREYKLDAYLTLGVREVWLIDPKDRSATIGRRGRPVTTDHEELLWHPPASVPALAIGLARLFKDLPSE
jgi:Uma2 family endonuclease